MIALARSSPAPSRPRMSPQDAQDLESYFGPAGGFGRSTLGPQLDRAEQLYRDSRGDVVDVRRILTIQRELAGSTPEAPRFAEILSPWPYQYVRREAPTGAGVEPEDRDDELRLAARVSRRLSQLGPQDRGALELLYGDTGCRWERQERRDGRRWGRVWALVPGTKPARAALARDDAARIELGRPRAQLRPAERLAVLADVRPRPGWVDGALDLAEKERRAAEQAWGATG